MGVHLWQAIITDSPIPSPWLSAVVNIDPACDPTLTLTVILTRALNTLNTLNTLNALNTLNTPNTLNTLNTMNTLNTLNTTLTALLPYLPHSSTQSWSPSGSGAIMASKVDTGAGEVIFKSEVQVAQVSASCRIRIASTPPLRPILIGTGEKTVLGPMASSIKVTCHQTLSTCERGQVLEVDRVW